MTRTVELTPELERFAQECIDAGRYNDVSDVVRSALALLLKYEEQRREFSESIAAAQAEADREGTFTLEEVLAEVDAVIEAAEK